MKPSLNIKLGQHITMTPQLQHAIKLLQLTSNELELEIQDLLSSNLMLETNEETEDSFTDTEQVTDNSIPDELPVDTKWEDIYPDNYGSSFKNDESTNIENFDGSTIENCLHDYLLWQLNLTRFSDQDKQIGLAIIDAIDDDGYLTVDIEEILTSVDNPDGELELDDVETVLHRIQQFDPQGVGCRNLKECLEIQLNAFPKELPFLKETKKLVAAHLDLLAKKNYIRIKSRLNLSEEELNNIINILSKLNPKPGSKLLSNKSTFITPDVIVVKRNNKWVLELNQDYIPRLKINTNYSSLIQRANSSRENKFLQEQLYEAKWFLKSLENRHQTLLKVATCIVEKQQAFLDYGPEAMRPLVLKDIADQIEIHCSTVSRVTTGKYLHTPRGTFELKYFFSSHVNTNSGDECSSTAIRALIEKLINEENQQKPFSDSKISKMLADKGIKIARRTVAKYRESMAIPPSNERKTLS